MYLFNALHLENKRGWRLMMDFPTLKTSVVFKALGPTLIDTAVGQCFLNLAPSARNNGQYSMEYIMEYDFLLDYGTTSNPNVTINKVSIDTGMTVFFIQTKVADTAAEAIQNQTFTLNNL